MCTSGWCLDPFSTSCSASQAHTHGSSVLCVATCAFLCECWHALCFMAYLYYFARRSRHMHFVFLVAQHVGELAGELAHTFRVWKLFVIVNREMCTSLLRACRASKRMNHTHTNATKYVCRRIRLSTIPTMLSTRKAPNKIQSREMKIPFRIAAPRERAQTQTHTHIVYIRTHALQTEISISCVPACLPASAAVPDPSAHVQCACT